MGGDEPPIVVCDRTPAPCHGLRLRRRGADWGSPPLGVHPGRLSGRNEGCHNRIGRRVSRGGPRCHARGERFNADKE